MPFFNNKGTKLYYETAGNGPPLILINGLGCDTRSFEPLVHANKERFRFINFDSRCAGKSDKPAETLTLKILANDVIELAKHLKLSRMNLLGFSMGGVVAMEVALRKPELIERLFLVSTFASLKGPCPPAKETLKLLHRTDVSEELLAEVFDRSFGPKFKERIPVEAFIKLRLSDPNPQPTSAYLNQLQACEGFDLTERVKDITCKTTIVVGDNDPFISPENSKWLNSQIKDSTLKVLKGVGHMAPIEAPDSILSW